MANSKRQLLGNVWQSRKFYQSSPKTFNWRSNWFSLIDLDIKCSLSHSLSNQPINSQCHDKEFAKLRLAVIEFNSFKINRQCLLLIRLKGSRFAARLTEIVWFLKPAFLRASPDALGSAWGTTKLEALYQKLRQRGALKRTYFWSPSLCVDLLAVGCERKRLIA